MLEDKEENFKNTNGQVSLKKLLLIFNWCKLDKPTLGPAMQVNASVLLYSE